MVQTSRVKKEFLDSLPKIKKEQILIMPFYPELKLVDSAFVERQKNTFVYVSSGSPYKNNIRLIEAFIIFYQKYKVGKLYLTIGNEFHILQALIKEYQQKGFPIVNCGFMERKALAKLYRENEFLIFPSLSESFGLGLIEAMENGCKIIGANLDYTFAVCDPSLVFEPESIDSIENAFKIAVLNELKPTKQLVRNEIDELIEILKNNHVKK